MSHLIEFDFDAAIAQKNKFASKPAMERAESPVDLLTAEMLGAGNTAGSLQAVRLLIVVEKSNYSAYLSNWTTAWQDSPKRSVAQVSHADTHILNAASVWSQQMQEVAIFSCYSDTDYSEFCPLGIRLIGSGLTSKESFWGQSAKQAKQNEKKLLRLAADFCPTHIVITTPNHALLSWANRCHINSVVLLPNGFSNGPSDEQTSQDRQQRSQLKAFIKQLKHAQVQWIGSRSLSACEAIAGKGVAAGKLIPWEWLNPRALDQHPPKTLKTSDRDYIQLLYAGSLENSSRVSDLLAALSYLKQRGHQARLEMLLDAATPQLDLQLLSRRSRQLDVLTSITISLSDSVEQLLMQARDADIVVIPGDALGSELFGTDAPWTEPPIVVQAAMAACTPIVVCDRSTFKDHLMHGVNAMTFPEGNEKAMVHRIERLMGQPQLYAQLSEAGNIAQRIVPAAWKDIVERWLSSDPADRQWLRNYTLSSDWYQALKGQSSEPQDLELRIPEAAFA